MFVALAQSMGVRATRISEPQALDAAPNEAYAQSEPMLVDIAV